MLTIFFRRGVVVPSLTSRFLPRLFYFRSTSLKVINADIEKTRSELVDNGPASATYSYSSRIHLSPLFSDCGPPLQSCSIEVLDDDAWQVSAGLAQAWQGLNRTSGIKTSAETADEFQDQSLPVEEEPEFDEIDNMRIRGNLFYKIDRGSKEFEEYSFDFHRKKSPKCKEDTKDRKKKADLRRNTLSKDERLPKIEKKKSVPSLLDESDAAVLVNKKLRTPTFNQITGPYHEPFCLDIYISKASVRACIVHRVTSKVVAVAHSISKDMKFDLASTRNAAACAAVGEILAQRALADDIYDVIYTPRKGEKLEGKLMIVLQAVIDNGVRVKLKLKQRKPKKVNHHTLVYK